MIFYLIFILVWVAIVTLAKDKMKMKIKKFLNFEIESEESQHSTIYDNIQKEYTNLQSILNMNVLSIKDELSRRVTKKRSTGKIKTDVVKDIDIEADEQSLTLNMTMVFNKTIRILKNLLIDLLDKIKSWLA